MLPYVHASGPRGYCVWKRGDIFIQLINNSGANKDDGLIILKTQQRRQVVKVHDTLPSLDMMLPKTDASLDITAMIHHVYDT